MLLWRLLLLSILGVWPGRPVARGLLLGGGGGCLGGCLLGRGRHRALLRWVAGLGL